MALRLSVFLITSLAALAARADAIVGQTFPIAEPDTMTEIQERVAKTDWEGMRRRMTSQSPAFQSARLPPATADASRLFDPTYTLPRDIADASGKVLFAQGTRVNVYRRIKETRRFIVISDLESHYRWLKEVAKPSGEDLVLLANGNVYDAREHTSLDLYLLDDRFIERFGLRHVPSIVQQEGTMLRVHEYALR
jgi:conjugal transfer pilus assembly protein TraW